MTRCAVSDRAEPVDVRRCSLCRRKRNERPREPLAFETPARNLCCVA